MNLKKFTIIIAVILCFTMVVTGCSSKKAPEKVTAESSKDVSEKTAVSDNDSSLQRVLDAGQLTVVGSGGYPPFNYIDDDGKVIGFDVDVGAEIASRLGVKLNYVTGEWSGLIEGLRAGRYDGILGSMAITDERAQTVNFSIPYYYSGAQLVVRTDSGLTDPSEMTGKTVGVVTATNFVKDAEALKAQTKLYEDDNLTMMELVNGRVDGVISDRLVALKAINELKGGDKLKLCGKVMRLEKMGIAIKKEDKSLLKKIDKILQDMHDDGTLTTISKKWQNGSDITVK